MMLSLPLRDRLFFKITDACMGVVPVKHYFLKLMHVSHSAAFFAASKL